jgi:hypothetical protein
MGYGLSVALSTAGTPAARYGEVGFSGWVVGVAA